MARKEFIEAAYELSKQSYEGKLSKREAIAELARQGMNEGAAFINVNVFSHLMNGNNFTRTLSAPTFEYFLERILNDFGAEQLRRCLTGLSKHIEYRESFGNFKMRTVRDIFERYQSNITIAEQEISAVEEEEEEEAKEFPEGREKFRLHRFKERNRKLVAAAKKKLKERDPEMKCEVCDFSFQKRYGALGTDFIEAHHVSPISELQEETSTKVEDLAMVCSNCHRMLHIRRPWLGLAELKNILL